MCRENGLVRALPTRLPGDPSPSRCDRGDDAAGAPPVAWVEGDDLQAVESGDRVADPSMAWFVWALVVVGEVVSPRIEAMEEMVDRELEAEWWSLPQGGWAPSSRSVAKSAPEVRQAGLAPRGSELACTTNP